MTTTRSGVSALLSLVLALSLSLPAGATNAPSCAVTPAVAPVGSAITVTVSGVTDKQARYGWFAVYDVGPTTRQAATTLTPVPTGDNGSGVTSRVGSTVTFLFYVQPDLGPHQVSAVYRRVFATCSYVATT